MGTLALVDRDGQECPPYGKDCTKSKLNMIQ